jgi:hypothetical protein
MNGLVDIWNGYDIASKSPDIGILKAIHYKVNQELHGIDAANNSKDFSASDLHGGKNLKL